MIPVFQPFSDEEEEKALAEVIRSHWWGLGPKTEEFEKKFSEYIGTGSAVGLNSGTSALHLAVDSLGVGQGDEVIMPSMTFISCAHSVVYCGGVPVFADVNPNTITLDPRDVEKKITARTKAIMAVHYAGHPCDMQEILRIADSHNIPVIEDCAHSAGAEYKNRKTGSIGSVGCFSFHPVKNIATGDGGMLTTDDPEVADAVRTKRWLGITKTTWDRYAAPARQGGQPSWAYEVNVLGYKYHMNDIQAALGLVQLSRLEKTNSRRSLIAKFYRDELSRIDSVNVPEEQSWAKSSWHLFVVKAERRDELYSYLSQRGITTSVHYVPIHLMGFYANRAGSKTLPVTERLASRILTLPMYPNLTEPDLHRVVDTMLQFYREH